MKQEKPHVLVTNEARHRGTTPRLSFTYVHLNRVIDRYDLNVI